MNVAAIRDGLKARLDTIDGLRGYDTEPDKPEFNAAVVSPDDPFIDYHLAMHKGLTEVKFRVVLLVPRSKGADRAQDSLDSYLSAGTGVTTSVIDAIEADQTLGGAVSNTLVQSAGAYGSTSVGNPGIECMTAALSVTVRAPRT